MAERLRRRQDDHSVARSLDPPLRQHRDRQRQLALQEPPRRSSPRPPPRRRRNPGQLRRRERYRQNQPLKGVPFGCPIGGPNSTPIDSVDAVLGTMGLATLATSALSAGSDVIASASDEFVLSKWLQGWKPNQFVEGPAKQFLIEPDKRERPAA